MRVLTITSAALLAFGSIAHGVTTFIDTFENDTVGQPAANWTIVNANGSTITGNVAQEGGPSGNKYLALRDTSAALDFSAQRVIDGDKQGFIKFDIRFNQGPDQQLQFEPIASAPGFPANYEPINIQWQHPFNNPLAGPMWLRSVGNGEYTTVVPNFPIGSWETITIFFQSASAGVPRGSYSVIWNSTTIYSSYLNQGENNQKIEYFRFTTTANALTNGSIDFDNVTFVPEPTASLAIGILVSGIGLKRRRR